MYIIFKCDSEPDFIIPNWIFQINFLLKKGMRSQARNGTCLKVCKVVPAWRQESHFEPREERRHPQPSSGKASFQTGDFRPR